MLRLGCDIDGILAEFNNSYAKLLTRRSGIPFPKSSSEWPQVWFWERAGGITKDIETEVWTKDILGSSTFWKNLDFLPNARSSIQWLNRLSKTNEVYFITNRPGESAKYQTEKWLYNLGMNYPTVIIASDKLPLVKALKLDFYIDDKPETIQEIAAANLPNLRLYLRETFYNRMEPCGSPQLGANCFVCGGSGFVKRTYPDNVRRCPDVLTALQESYGQ